MYNGTHKQTPPPQEFKMSERRLRELEERASTAERRLTDLEDRIIDMDHYNKDTDVTINLLIKKLHIVSEKLEEVDNKLYDPIT